MNYILHILVMINIYIILSASANLLVGMSNLLSLGQAAFYGIGAYVAAFTLKPELHGISFLLFQIPLVPSIFITMFIASIIGACLGWITLRLKGDYFVLATLGFQIITYSVLYNWTEVTKGPFGIPGINAPKLFGKFAISGTWAYLTLSTTLVIFILMILYFIINSPHGRILRAMRNNEIALQTSGRNITSFKIRLFVISSAFTAVAGFIFASYISYIDPTSFNLDESIFILTALLIGGTGNIKGPVMGAIFVIVLPEILRFLNLPDAQAANLRMIIYGLLIIILMRFRPQGLMGNYKL